MRELEGEAVILDIRSEVYFSLDDVSTFIWNQIDGQRRLEAIGRAIVAEYEIDEATALSDLDEFVRSLVSAGLVEFGD